MIDETNETLNITHTQRMTLSKNLCASKNFDADGILYVQNTTNKKCLGKMDMFNADGSQAEMCGNGIRCVARFLFEKYALTHFLIETKNDSIIIKKERDIYSNIPTFNAIIQPVSLDPKTLPMLCNTPTFINKKIKNLKNISNFSAISVQNPHIVFIKNDINKEEIIKYGKIINTDVSLFPNQVNINFVKILNKTSIFVLTNERGSGITPSCGTGMSSSTYIACQLGYCDFNKNIEVFNNGGKVICKADNINKNIHLIGNATYIQEYTICIDENMNIHSKRVTKEYEDESNNYKKFLTHTSSL